MKKRRIKNLIKAKNRIIKAIKNNEKIFLYGDSDLDGISALIILEETIKLLGGKINGIYFPKREEGYGLTKKGISFLKRKKPNLLICLDLGTTNQKEIEKIKKNKIDVIVVDHHNILKENPKAIFVNPKQKGERYPFKAYATCGLVYKLSKEMLPVKLFRNVKKRFLELSLLGTLYDLVPRKGENKKIIDQGIKSLNNPENLGISILLKQDPIKEIKDNSQKIDKMISILSSGDIKNHIPQGYKFLKSNRKEEIRKLLKALIKGYKKRKNKIKKIIKEVEKKIKKEEKFIFEYKRDWEVVYLGASASRICLKYKKPVYLAGKGNSGILMGSIRSPKNINSLDSLKSCSSFLIGYGGHPQASGFRLKKENLEKFKNCLIKYYERKAK
jgi:single-stranded-DNA-specific exonuclease